VIDALTKAALHLQTIEDRRDWQEESARCDREIVRLEVALARIEREARENENERSKVVEAMQA
jgi:hypothetical protein